VLARGTFEDNAGGELQELLVAGVDAASKRPLVPALAAKLFRWELQVLLEVQTIERSRACTRKGYHVRLKERTG